MSRLLLLLLALGAWRPAQAAGPDPVTAACDAYERAIAATGAERERLLREAVAGLQAERAASPALRPWLEYDLGTALLMAEDYGRAVFHLKRAAAALPGEPRVRRNLARAGQIAGVEVEPAAAGGLADILRGYWRRSPPLAWWALLVVASWGLAAFEATRRGPRPAWRLLLHVALLAALLAAAWGRQQGLGLRREAVLLEAATPRTGLGDGYPPALSAPLKPGTTGVLLRREMGWLEVRWKEASGWIPQAAAGVVGP